MWRLPRNRLALFLLIAVLTFAAYSFAVQGSFKTMDDEYCIIHNPQLRSLRNIPGILTSSFFGNNSYYRPLVTLSFLTEYQLFGLNPFYFYLTNILIHILTAGVVLLLAERLLGDRRQAFFVSLLFAVHPIQWEAVSNIPGRAILLSAFFSLLAVQFYITGGRQRWGLGLSLTAFVLGLLSKESAGMVPFLIVAYDGILARREQGWTNRLRPALPYFTVAAVYVLLRRILGITNLFYWPSPGQALLGFLSFLRGTITFLRLLILPVGLQFDRAQRLFAGALDPGIFFALAFYALLVILILRFRRHLSPVMMFVGVWYVIELFPVSQLVSSIGVQPGYISLAEHFLYSASVGVFALLVLAGARLGDWLKTSGRASDRSLRFVMGGVLVFFWLMTVQQNIYSSNEVSMFRRTLELNPRNSRVRYNLGYVLAQNGYYAEAEGHFRHVLQVNPEVVNARIALGKALCDQGKYWDGLQEYERVRNPGHLQGTLQGNKQHAYQQLRIQYEGQITADPEDAAAHFGLGVLFSKQGDLDFAGYHFEQAFLIDPQDPDTIFNLASILAAQGQDQRARNHFALLLKILPEDHVLLPHARHHLEALGFRDVFDKINKVNDL